MMSGTKRTSVRVLCCVIAAIFVLGSVFVLVQKMSAGQKAEEEIPEWEAYPEWDKVTAKDKINSNARLTFTGIDFDVPVSGEDYSQDHILFRLENISDRYNINVGDIFRIDKQYEGEWYTIYYTPFSRLISIAYEPGADVQSKVQVPAGLITREGLYRVYLEDIGYCEMDIPFDSPQANS